jgi:hypothetical protein
MSETRFTPGPWDAGVSEILGKRRFTVAPEYNHGIAVSICGDCGAEDEEESIANANLIAAAPDMYEALEAAILEYGKPGGPWNVPSSPGSWIDKAKAALVKARGEQ